MASAIAMDKVRSKHLFRAAGIPTPDYVVVRTRDEASVAAEQVGFPLIIKPSGQGSSVGMSKVFERAELNDAVEIALQYGDTVLLETCVTGSEFTVAVLQGKALPSIRIVTPRVFYDYRAKYESDRTDYICPGTETDDEEADPKIWSPTTLSCAIPEPFNRRLFSILCSLGRQLRRGSLLDSGRFPIVVPSGIFASAQHV